MEGVNTDSQVEGILAGSLCNILVGADTGSFECFGRQLLVLVGNKMAAEWEFVYRGTFTTQVENTNLQRPIYGV